MRLPIFSLATICAAALLSGCDKQSSTPEPPKSEPKPAANTTAPAAEKVSVDKLLELLSSAGPEERSRAGKAAQAIRAESYPAAQKILELLLSEGHLTPEQRDVVTSTILRLKQITTPVP